MKILSVTFLAAFASTLAVSSAVAQTRFCLGGDLEHMTAAQKASCSAKLQAVKSVAASVHAPADWHFVVVCGNEGWNSYAAFQAPEDTALLAADADTHLDQHETFLREGSLNLAKPEMLHRAVAREVAGIVLHSHDEAAIARQVHAWMSRDAVHSGF